MTGLARILVAGASLILLGGCMQRTVTHTDSRISFGEGWAQEVGDVDKIKEKFSSGFEIKDGVAVASGGQGNITGKTYPLKNLEVENLSLNQGARETGKSFQTLSLFKGVSAFKTSEARESRSAFAANSAQGFDQEFATGSADVSGKAYESDGQAARESKLDFFGSKRAARESSARSTQARADVVLDAGRLKETPSSLSEQQVRDILHPGS